MGSILAKIQKSVRKCFCFLYSALFFICAFAFISMISIGSWDNFDKGILTFAIFFYLICGGLFLAAGLHNPDTAAERKLPRFFTLNKDGEITLTEVTVPPPLDYKEIRRTDGEVEVSMELRSKEQAVEVLATLAVMYDRGDISGADYHDNVRKLREHFNL